MLPMSVLGFFGIIGGTCVLFLPETGNKPLKDNIKDDGNDKSKISTCNLNDSNLHI